MMPSGAGFHPASTKGLFCRGARGEMAHGKAVSRSVKQAGKAWDQAPAATGGGRLRFLCKKSLIFGLDKFSDMVRINP
jgi:hypothetical protein